MARKREDPNQLRLFETAAEASAPSAGAARADQNAASRGSKSPAVADVAPAAVLSEHAATAAKLSPNVRLATSSWSFPGWAGIVYDHEVDESTLARAGLAAYSRHPLLRAAGIDKTYYRPITAAAFRQLADQTPGDFRFLVKAAQDCTAPTSRAAGGAKPSPNSLPGREGAKMTAPNPNFLNPAWTIERVVEPFADGLGAKAGVLVFQFSKFRFQKTALKRGGGASPRTADEFLDRLAAFLGALPRGVPYAVEVRNEELWGEAYFRVLREAGASHCYNVHPQMPPIAEQARVLPPADNPGPLAVRWMLERSQTYEGARDAYAPFNRLVDEDPASRSAIAALCIAAARVGRDILVVANNKAEGSAPLTLFKLARQIVADWEDAG